MEGTTCLITGATSGIGRATAIALAKMGRDLVLVGRNERVGTVLAEKLAKEQAIRTEFIRTDISDQEQVWKLAATVRQRYSHLDVLINNAGAKFDRYQESADGIEMTFATNHLGHFLLTALLLDSLLAAPCARIVAVSSGSHGGARADVEWCQQAESYDRRQAYAKSKLANLLFSYELARRLRKTGISVNALDPGAVATNFGRNNGLIRWLKHITYHAIKGELVSAERGASTVIFLASDPSIKSVTGAYFMDSIQVDSSPISKDKAVARQLWELSLKLTSLKESVGRTWEWLRPEPEPSG